MIYFYKALRGHDIEKLHSFVDFFFEKLFATTSTAYDPARYLHPNFASIANKKRNKGWKIADLLKRIFTAYMRLTPSGKRIVKKAYANNNNIKGICSGKCVPMKFDELPAGIRKSIENLYDKLWQPILGYKDVEGICGTIKKHFNDFRSLNKNYVCPFCGLESLLCAHDDGRDDYDHYIPKAQYPFACVNFYNLVPMCHRCNSKSKGQIDPVFTDTIPPKRRKLYYPFDASITKHKIKISIDSKSINLDDPSTWNLVIDCTPSSSSAKKDAWAEIFKIENRYKAKIAIKNYYWKENILKKYSGKSKNPHFEFEEFKKDILSNYEDIFMESEAIIERCFHEFLFSVPGFESSLSGKGII